MAAKERLSSKNGGQPDRAGRDGSLPVSPRASPGVDTGPKAVPDLASWML